MKHTLLLITTLLLAACSGDRPKTETTEEPAVSNRIFVSNEAKAMGVKGKVKRMTLKTYNNVVKKFDKWEIVDSNDYLFTDITFYEDGKRESLTVFNVENGRQDAPYIAKFKYIITDSNIVVQKYDSDNNLKTDGIITRISSHTFKDVTTDVKMERQYTIDENGYIAKSETIAYIEDEVYKHYKTINQWNKYQDILTEVYTDLKNNISDTSLHITIKEDAQANRTEVLRQSDDVAILLYTYEYYQ